MKWVETLEDIFDKHSFNSFKLL